MILFADESYRIMGAGFEVYKIKGAGFVEPVYQDCLEIEPEPREIPFTPKAQLVLTYKDRTLKHHYETDFVCFGRIIVESRDQSRVPALRRISRPGAQLFEKHRISVGSPGQLLSPPAA